MEYMVFTMHDDYCCTVKTESKYPEAPTCTNPQELKAVLENYNQKIPGLRYSYDDRRTMSDNIGIFYHRDWLLNNAYAMLNVIILRGINFNVPPRHTMELPDKAILQECYVAEGIVKFQNGKLTAGSETARPIAIGQYAHSYAIRPNRVCYAEFGGTAHSKQGGVAIARRNSLAIADDKGISVGLGVQSTAKATNHSQAYGLNPDSMIEIGRNSTGHIYSDGIKIDNPWSQPIYSISRHQPQHVPQTQETYTPQNEPSRSADIDRIMNVINWNENSPREAYPHQYQFRH